MKLYLKGIKSYQLDLGIDCAVFCDPHLERTIHGIKRDHNEPERRIRTPLICPHLLSILYHLRLDTYDNIVLQAAFTLAFAAFLRIGEFTYLDADKQLGHTFSRWFLTKGSIHVAQDASYLELTIHASKTDPFRKGIMLTIAATNDLACPVHSMRKLQAIDSHCPPHAPLFCVGKHDPYSFLREYIVQRLQELAATAGLEGDNWNGHSFRRGAATWAAQVGISDTEIQVLGRWRSDAYKAYIEYTGEERIALSKRFQHNQTITR